MGRATGTTAAPTSGQQQGEGRGSMRWSALTEAMKMFGPAEKTQEFSKKTTKMAVKCRGGVDKARHV